MKRAATLFLLALVLVELTSHAANAKLTWTAPTKNVDGSALTNLAGFVVQYRPKGTTTWKVRKVANAGATTVTIWQLAPGTWQFRLKAYNNVGIRSIATGTVEAVLR